jgi:hypothetical protein
MDVEKNVTKRILHFTSFITVVRSPNYSTVVRIICHSLLSSSSLERAREVFQVIENTIPLIIVYCSYARRWSEKEGKHDVTVPIIPQVEDTRLLTWPPFDRLCRVPNLLSSIHSIS